MKFKKLGVAGLIASLVIFIAFAYAQQQTDPSMQQSSPTQQQVMQDPAMIKQIQQALSDKGYKPGPADGIWGSKTESALKKFQQAEGMQATGQPDEQTLASLGVKGEAAGGQESMPDEQSGAGTGGQESLPDEQSGAGAGGQEGSMSDEQSGQMSGSQPESSE